jgi:putative nucleotidyltransferase with HDIG domain
MATSVQLAERVRVESLDVPAGSARARELRQPRARASPEGQARAAAPLSRYLPLSLLVSASIMLAPAALVAAIVPRGGALLGLASVALAVVGSLLLAGGEAALWKRCRGSRDVVFADLMLWGWARRRWAERRLARARALYDSARRAGPAVSVGLLTTLTERLEARDAYTHGHSQRVARHAERIARAMHLDPIQTAKIRTAAAVHDVGKLHTPRSILNNPKRLSQAEFEVMKRHAADGAEMLAAVGDPEIAAMVRHHHERIDGSGYPDGLAGASIPLGSRIIAVADTFDSITSNRAYRRADTQKRALDVLSREAGRQFDEDAVAAFRHRYSARASIAGWAVAAAAFQRVLAPAQSGTAGLGTVAGGVGSLLPALGAAGLLALSPGLHRQTPGAPGARSAQPAGLSAPAPGPSLATAIAGGARGPAIVHTGHRGPGPARHPTRKPVSSVPAPVPAGQAGTGATSGGASGASGSPPGSQPSSPPSSTGRTGGGGHSSPAIPVSPPATPSVPVPTVGTPAVSTPSVSTPTVTTPVIPIPGITVPGATAPGVTVSGAAG